MRILASLRLFVALWPTAATRTAVVAAQDALRWPAGARRVSGPDLHLTLAFIGAVPQEQLAEVTQAAGIGSASIELVLDQLEVWRGATVVLRPSAVPAALATCRAGWCVRCRPAACLSTHGRLHRM